LQDVNAVDLSRFCYTMAFDCAKFSIQLFFGKLWVEDPKISVKFLIMLG